MKATFLKDFEKWKQLNGKSEFSIFDYIFHTTKEINSDLFFAFLEFFWPSFIECDQHVFLESNFSKKKIKDLENEKNNTEYWINLLLINPYFEKDNDVKKRSKSLIESLIKIWQIKLCHDFPDRKFVVQYVYDEECGDYGLTFYQPKNQTAHT